MVQLGFDSDDEDLNFNDQQKFTIRKPINPYICSTPCDFESERDFLETTIFPQLEELCLLRGTTFSPTDLRWMPNSLQTDTGQLLKLQLDYITKCSPYFLCLLGETYGPHREPECGKLPESLHNLPENVSWLDRNYLIAASSGYSWILKEVHQNCSIPELEIIQAAFLGDNRYAHFYYRQPEHLDHKLQDVSDSERQQLLSLHKPETEYADLNIRDLKQRIVNKGLPVKYFQTNIELGNLVLTDWREIIDELYPPLVDGPSILDKEVYQEWLCNEVFAESRRQIYLNHSDLRTLKGEITKFCVCALDDPGFDPDDEISPRYRPSSVASVFRKKSDVTVRYKSILVLKSDRGMGKTSLVANWVKQFTAENPEIKVISHFVGCNGQSRDITSFMRKCILELREEYLSEDSCDVRDKEVATQNFKQLCGSFQASLTLGPCVLLIDGVDELGTSLELSPQEIKKFSWLPMPLPPQCRIVMTTFTSDLSHAGLQKRPDAKFLLLPNLNTTKVKAEVLEDHMQMHFEHLKRSQLQTIYESKLSGRPLFLSLLGNEMCSYSIYMELDTYTETIREMCTSIRDLFIRCVKRWSHDHSWTYEVLSAEQAEKEDIDFIGWVPDVLRLLAVSRSGLSSSEILNILVTMGYQENVKVTLFDWLMFLLCIGDNIIQSPKGILNFSHQHMREIVEYVLLRVVKPSTAEIISSSDVEKSWKKQKTEFHQHIVNFFIDQPICLRKAQELPWQLLMAGEFKQLENLLVDPQVFEMLYDEHGNYPSNHYDLKLYWHYLEKEGISVVTSYTDLLVKLDILQPEPDKLEVESLDGSLSGGEEMSEVESSIQDNVPHIMLFTPTSPSIPTIYTTPASDHKLSVIEEASDIMSRDDKSSLDGTDPVFYLTQDNNGEGTNEVKYDLSPAQVTNITWNISQFLLELGHKEAGEKILLALNSRLVKSYPLSNDEQLVQARVQESLGYIYYENGDYLESQMWYKKSMQSILDLSEMEDIEGIFTDIRILKCKVIQQIGCLCVYEGLLDDGESLLQEALDLSEICQKLPLRANVLYHIGLLRIQQSDYLMAETNLRKCMYLRKKWYGSNHLLVGDVMFLLATLIGNEENDNGYNRQSAVEYYRKCLEIRELHLDKDHLSIAQVLFELGKLLKYETSYSGKAECQSMLSRALDIRITQLGGDHIETRDVRKYLNNLEVSLKSSKQEGRSSERPYSSLSWRSHDLANIERKSRLQSGRSSSHLSRPGSQLSRTGSYISQNASRLSRPVSGQYDTRGMSISTKTSMMSNMSPSERYLQENRNARLLHRESMNRKLKQNGPLTPKMVIHLDQHVDTDRKDDTDSKSAQEVTNGVLLDSFCADGDKTIVKFKSNTPEGPLGRETPPQRLYRRYGSPENTNKGYVDSLSPTKTGEVVLRTSETSLVPKRESSVKLKRPLGSARSMRSNGSSLYTSASGMSMESHKSNCDIPRGPHSVHLSNSRTITMGPNSSVKSLMGDQGPKDISRGIHHKSAWYHVPGRYSAIKSKYPPKRSQKRGEAKALEKSISPVAPDPYVTFMRSDYRKSNPKMLHKGYPDRKGHTCGKNIVYPPYPRDDSKKYTICDKCQREAEDILTAQENELLGIVEGDGCLAPTVNGLTAPDRPRQMGYVFEEPIVPDDYNEYQQNGPSTVTFNEAVMIN
ncbi:hypothetical protein ACF0H5_014369 [Mactra antiquata]